MTLKAWKGRMLRGSAAVQARVPATASVLARAERLGRSAANLRRLAGVDLSSLSERIDLAIALAEPPVEPLLRPNTRTVAYRSEGDHRPRGVICSLGTGRHVELLSIAAPTFVAYGQRHGWDVVLSTEEDLSEGRPAPWGKITLIQQLLDEYELVWWIDADALIVDTSRDVRDELDDDKDLYLIEHLFEWPFQHGANSGVMIWRSTEWSKAFLAEIWAQEKFIHYYIWENAALLELLGVRLWPFVHTVPTPWMERVKMLGVEWNSVWPDPAAHPLINHHGGNIEWADRRGYMLADLARFRRGHPPQMGPARQALAEGTPPRTYLTHRRPASTMTRADLPELLNERRLLGCGVEVGVFAGEFSARLLNHWRGRQLVSVDPWEATPGDDQLDAGDDGVAGAELLFETSRVRLERFGDRSRIWRMTSAEATERLPDGCLDFVYLAVRPDEESVRHELELWLPKVRPGGIVAGHHYVTPDLPEDAAGPGVKAAVDSFFGTRGRRVHVTGEPTFPSWIVELDAEPARP
ncbi:MAG: class I SAM-dependent methyltransferase [Acidimicrobiales bacterium]